MFELSDAYPGACLAALVNGRVLGFTRLREDAFNEGVGDQIINSNLTAEEAQRLAKELGGPIAATTGNEGSAAPPKAKVDKPPRKEEKGAVAAPK